MVSAQNNDDLASYYILSPSHTTLAPNKVSTIMWKLYTCAPPKEQSAPFHLLWYVPTQYFG